MKKIKPSKMILIFIIFLSFLTILSLIFYYNISKTKTVTATITAKGQNYIIVTDTNKQEYKLFTTINANLSDLVSITINNINDKKDPITADVQNITIISKPIEFTIDDTEKTTPEENNQEENTNEEKTLTTNQEENQTNYTEDDIVNYLNTFNEEITTTNDKTISKTFKEKFITIIDFLFYDGTIYGKKYSELTNSAKLKVLRIAYIIDNNLEKKYPNYKESIETTSTNTYNNIKEKIIELYLDTTVKVCKNNTDLCSNAKEGLKDLKENFSLTWDTIKELAKNNASKLKSWYEIWREQ